MCGLVNWFYVCFKSFNWIVNGLALLVFVVEKREINTERSGVALLLSNASS